MKLQLRMSILRRDGFRCRYCGRSAPEVVLEVDHIRSRRDGGTDDPTNLAACCRDCNGGKGGQSFDDAPDSCTLEEWNKARRWAWGIQRRNEWRPLPIGAVQKLVAACPMLPMAMREHYDTEHPLPPVDALPAKVVAARKVGII